jgi:opacity protein-like surface antigen
MKLALSVAALVAVGLPAATSAQCVVPRGSNEARLLAFFAAPIAFSPAGNLSRLAGGDLRVSFDATWVPAPPAAIQKSNLCFKKDKQENTELAPVFPRPRVALGLGAGFYVEGSYLPPVTVLDAQPNLGSVAIGYVRTISTSPEGREMAVAVRLHSTFGRVRGPITCSEDALQQESASVACYGTAPSKDTYKPNMMAAEGALTWRGRGPVAAYVGAGYTSLKPRFQVGFQPTGERFDDTKVEVDLNRVAAFAGGSYRVGARGAITGELYSVPQDVTTFRLGARWMLRGSQ